MEKELPMNKDIYRRMLKSEKFALINAKTILETRIEWMDKLLKELDRL